MGANWFVVVQKGLSFHEAYVSAVEVAKQVHGTDPYNGTISTTRGWKRYTPSARFIEQCRKHDLEASLLRVSVQWAEHEEVMDKFEKFGPAGACYAGDGLFVFFGWAAT